MAGERGQRRGRGALAAHVADGEPEAALADLPEVVEVAADHVVLARSAVPGHHLDVGQVGQPQRQQAALQRPGDLLLLGVQTRVCDRQRRVGGEVLGEGDVALVEGAVGLGRDEDQRTEELAACAQRHGQRRAQAELVEDQPRELGVRGGRLDHRAGQARGELRPAGAHDERDAGVAVGIGRIAAVELEPELDLARIAVLERDRADAGAVADVDRAPVGQPRHDQPRRSFGCAGSGLGATACRRRQNCRLDDDGNFHPDGRNRFDGNDARACAKNADD